MFHGPGRVRDPHAWGGMTWGDPDATYLTLALGGSLNNINNINSS